MPNDDRLCSSIVVSQFFVIVADVTSERTTADKTIDVKQKQVDYVTSFKSDSTLWMFVWGRFIWKPWTTREALISRELSTTSDGRRRAQNSMSLNYRLRRRVVDTIA
jgi:hypothetical protein